MNGEGQEGTSSREAIAPGDHGSFAPDMRIAIAMMQDSFDLPARVDEATLAAALREMVPDADGYIADVLAMLADALDKPNAEYRLRIVRNRRGRPKRDSDQTMGLVFFIERRMKDGGVPFKAAVMDAMEHFNCSRATVFRSLQHWRKLAKIGASLDNAAAAKRNAGS